MCDRAIETEGEAEIVLKAETRRRECSERAKECVCVCVLRGVGGGNKASDSATQGETFV